MGSAKGNLSLSAPQRHFLLGKVLGDGYLEQNGREVRLQVNHGPRQREYVEWCWQQLFNFVPGKPTQLTTGNFRFRTVTHPIFTRFHHYFYVNGRKGIPVTLKEILTHPFSLAVWYMDDGKRRPDCHAAYLDTICFTKDEQEVLMDTLKTNFGLDHLRLHWNGDGYHIYIPFVDIKRFYCLIEPYVIPSMRYKLPMVPRND